jgi:hypothetical protein
MAGLSLARRPGLAGHTHQTRPETPGSPAGRGRAPPFTSPSGRCSLSQPRPAGPCAFTSACPCASTTTRALPPQLQRGPEPGPLNADQTDSVAAGDGTRWPGQQPAGRPAEITVDYCCYACPLRSCIPVLPAAVRPWLSGAGGG